MAAKLFLKDSKSSLSILLRCSNVSASLKAAAIFPQTIPNLRVLNQSPGSQDLNFFLSASSTRGFSTGIGKLGGLVGKLEYSSAAGKSKRVVDEESDESEDVDDSDMEDFVDDDDIDINEEDSLDDDDDDDNDDEVVHKRRK